MWPCGGSSGKGRHFTLFKFTHNRSVARYQSRMDKYNSTHHFFLPLLRQICESVVVPGNAHKLAVDDYNMWELVNYYGEYLQFNILLFFY